MYRPLDRSRREIRLIEILNPDRLLSVVDAVRAHGLDPDRIAFIEEFEPIRCRIRHRSLDNNPAYSAVSYAWGDGKKERKVVVEEDREEYILQITTNARTAIRNISVKGEIWMDSICINQADYVERSWQVQQMLDICGSAKHVAAFLGPSANGTNLLFDQMIDFARLCMKKVLEEGQDLESWLPPDEFISLPAFSALMNRVYWRRVWIHQELSVAKDTAWFYCGWRKIHASYVWLALEFLERKYERLRNNALGVAQEFICQLAWGCDRR